MALIAKNSRTWQPNVTLQLSIMCFTRGLFVGYFSRASRKLVMNCADSSLKLNSSPISYTYPLRINLHTYRKMIEEITIKFGMELKPTQASWKSQFYRFLLFFFFFMVTENGLIALLCHWSLQQTYTKETVISKLFFFFFFENVYPTLIDEYGSFSKKKNKIMSVDEFWFPSNFVLLPTTIYFFTLIFVNRFCVFFVFCLT